jgi:hypothetical protein
MNSLPPRGDDRSTTSSKQVAFAALPLLGAGLKKLFWIGFWVWLLASLGLGWLVKGAVVLVVVLIGVPIAGFFGLQWWLKKNVVQGDCPVCGYEVTGLNGMQVSCSNCGEALRVESGRFARMSADGAIDVQAVDVDVQAVDVQAVDVDVQAVEVQAQRLD